MKRAILTGASSALVLGLAAGIAQAEPETYTIDTEHSFVQFKISHLGFSYLVGRFNNFEGEFTYNPDNPSASEVTATVDTESVDTDHSERDRHIRGEDFLEVSEYPEARFVSTSFEEHGDGEATLEGELTLHGTTREIAIDVEQVGAGEDPWGGYRRGFEGTVTLERPAFGLDYDLGEEAETVELYLSVEGVREE